MEFRLKINDFWRGLIRKSIMFDYETYCRDVLSTSEKLLDKVKQITIDTEHNYIVNSKTYKVSYFLPFHKCFDFL